MTKEFQIDLDSKIIPKKDIIFKKIFASEGSEKILKAFLLRAMSSLSASADATLIGTGIYGAESTRSGECSNATCSLETREC